MVNAKRDGQKQKVMKKGCKKHLMKEKRENVFHERDSFFLKKKSKTKKKGDRKVIFRKNKIENATKKKDETKKGEEQLKVFHWKRWKEGMIKETEKKHEGFPTIKGREKFFFFWKILATPPNRRE